MVRVREGQMFVTAIFGRGGEANVRGDRCPSTAPPRRPAAANRILAVRRRRSPRFFVFHISSNTTGRTQMDGDRPDGWVLTSR